MGRPKAKFSSNLLAYKRQQEEAEIVLFLKRLNFILHFGILMTQNVKQVDCIARVDNNNSVQTFHDNKCQHGTLTQ